jgi:hypothetical protein
VSSAQELKNTTFDKYGRFPHAASYQKHFDVTNKNRVQHCFDEIVRTNHHLNSLKKTNSRSKIFLSHDVDFINGALIQDGFFALKKLNIQAIFMVLFQNLFHKLQWLNMDDIMKIENEYDFKSTFYWLVNKGISNAGIKNADYDFSDIKIQNQFNNVLLNGWENGIHKSISSDSFETEIEKLKFKPTGNRYHFLKFLPHQNYTEIEYAGLKFDSSLGFAEEIGFRNNYGQPFKPFNFSTKKAYNFVECPLHIMDTTLHHYQKLGN